MGNGPLLEIVRNDLCINEEKCQTGLLEKKFWEVLSIKIKSIYLISEEN